MNSEPLDDAIESAGLNGERAIAVRSTIQLAARTGMRVTPNAVGALAVLAALGEPLGYTELDSVIGAPYKRAGKLRLGSGFRDQNPEGWLEAKRRARKLEKQNKRRARKCRDR